MQIQSSTTRSTPYPDVLPSAGVGILVFALLTGGIAGCVQWAAGLSDLYALKCVGLSPLLSLLVTGSLRRSTGLGPADVVTLFRAAITALVLGFIGEPLAAQVPTLLWFGAGLAFLLDAFDGWVARRTRSTSGFGASLDMELDALTVIGLGALLWWLDRAGMWALCAGALRYIYISATWVFPWMNAPLYPTQRRAWMCGVHLTAVIFALLPWPQPAISTLLTALGLFVLIGSFGTDVIWLFRNRT